MFLTEFVNQAAAVVMQCEHLPNGDIQWLLVMIEMCSIEQCAPHCTATPAWQLKSLAICLHFSLSPIGCCPIT
jgi:hypothetical protein